jgi:hypothetical protein
MGLAERSEQRRKRMVGHRANSFEDAERWDLEFWQKQTPQMRLAAYKAILRDIEKVKARRRDS